jgi:hypothetical protein
MMRTVMRVSVQASISAVQMSANSLKYVTSVFMASASKDLPHRAAARYVGCPTLGLGKALSHASHTNAGAAALPER